MEMLQLAPGSRTPPGINAYVSHTVSQEHEMEADRNSRHLRFSDDFFMIFSCFFLFFTWKNSFSWLELTLMTYIHVKNREELENLGPKKLQCKQLGEKFKKLQKFHFLDDFGWFSTWPTDRSTDGPTDGDKNCSNKNSHKNMYAETHACTPHQFWVGMTNRPTDGRPVE